MRNYLWESATSSTFFVDTASLENLTNTAEAELEFQSENALESRKTNTSVMSIIYEGHINDIR